MALPRYTPGKPKKVKVKPPHGHSQRTLTQKVHHATQQATAATPAPDPLDQPITPGSSITRRQAQRMAHNATNVRYGQQETGIGQQIASAQQLGVDQSGWYQQYLDALKGYQQSTQDRATATNTAVKALGDSFRGLDQSNATAQNTSMQADAATRGATVDPNLASRASDASVVRQALQGGLGALIANQGRSAGDRASNLAQVVGPGQRLQAQVQNVRNVGALQEQKTNLKGQEGSFAQQFIDSLRGDEAKNILAASIASGRDLTAKANTKETIRHHKADEGNTAAARKAAAAAKGETVNSYGYTTKEWAAFSPDRRRQIMAQVKKEQRAPGADKTPKPTSGPGSLTPVKEASIVSQIQQVVSIIKGSKRPDHELRMFFANGQNPLKKVIDPRIINIAFDVARKGGLSNPNVKAAHDLGIHVGGHFKKLNGHKVKVQGYTQQQSDTYKGIFGAS
jgi:hypothetical protein